MQPTMQKNNVKQRKTIAIIAMIAVAAIALAAVAIIAVSNKREMTQAASDTCALNAKALATHQESFEEAQQEAEEAAKLTVNDVADGTTLEIRTRLAARLDNTFHLQKRPPSRWSPAKNSDSSHDDIARLPETVKISLLTISEYRQDCIAIKRFHKLAYMEMADLEG